MAWSRLQSASESTGSALSIAYGTNLTAGTTLIAVVAMNGGTTSSVNDGNGHNFIKIPNVALMNGNAAIGEVSVWALNTPSGDVGTKPTITAVTGAGSGAGILIQEVSGLAIGATAAALADGTAGSSTGSGSSPIGPPSYTSTAVNEYLIYVYGDNGQSTTATVSGAYTADANNISGGVNNNICVGYKNSTNGTETGTYTLGNNSSSWGLVLVAFKLASAAAGPAFGPPPVPPGLQSPMSLAVPARFSVPPPPQQQPAPGPQPKPPGLQSPMSLAVPARPAGPPPPPPVVAPQIPPPLLKPPGLQSPMSLAEPSRPATQAPPAPPPAATPGSWQPLPPGRMSPMSLGLPMVQPPQAPSTPGPLPPTPPIPSGIVFGGQSSGGDRDPEIRVFRTIMPGEVPASGSALPKLQGRGYAAPPPERAEDLEHLWEAPAEPAAPPGPTPAEIVLGEAHRAAGALYDLGRILAPEPYVAPSRAACGALRRIGTETLKCKRKRGHPGMHSDRGVRWG